MEEDLLAGNLTGNPYSACLKEILSPFSVLPHTNGETVPTSSAVTSVPPLDGLEDPP